MSALLEVIAGPGPGRLATIAHPRADPWPADQVAELARHGVDVLVSALTRAEQQELGFGGTAETATRFGVDFVPFPPDAGNPRDEAATVIGLAALLAGHVRNGRFVATQCFGGVGRSTLLVCTTLVLLGLAPSEAVRRAADDSAGPMTRDWLHDLAVAGHG